jgi:hypothetical protein
MSSLKASFWDGFQKRAEDVGSAAQFSPTTNVVADKQTSFMDAIGIRSKHRGDDHIKYEDNYSTTGAFGY